MRAQRLAGPARNQHNDLDHRLKLYHFIRSLYRANDWVIASPVIDHGQILNTIFTSLSPFNNLCYEEVSSSNIKIVRYLNIALPGNKYCFAM